MRGRLFMLRTLWLGLFLAVCLGTMSGCGDKKQEEPQKVPNMLNRKFEKVKDAGKPEE
jgi:hypothetical protein